jgi:hypothetical protein
MGRTTPDHAGWALGYQRPSHGHTWEWREVNCHPTPI